MNKVSSLYLHFPFCRHLCNYCDFYKIKTSEEGAATLYLEYQRYLNESFIIHQRMLEENSVVFAPLETIYIGGGTPSMWGESGANFIQDFLHQNGLQLAPNIEFTLEVNPGGWRKGEIARWQEVGVNRFSIGLQTLNQNLLSLLDRAHSLEDSLNTLEFFSTLGLNYSVDLMLGLPSSIEHKRDLKREIEKILEYGPRHFSVYILTVKENYPQLKFIPHEDWVEKEYLEVVELLNSSGHAQYEVSNFSLAGFESKHNLKYWQSQSVAALGPSGVGLLNLGHKRALRYKWRPRNKAKEIPCELERLGAEELDMEQIYLALRTAQGIGWEHYSPTFDASNFRRLATSWESRGLAAKNSRGGWALTSRGMLVMDSLLGEFFMQKKQG